jgi:hypothetical protein
MLFLAVFILSCSEEHDELSTIDVADAFENQMEVKLSEFVTEVTYIPLETIKESYISDYPAVKVGDYIIVRNAGSGMPLLLFNRSDGKFIRTIGKVGRDLMNTVSRKRIITIPVKILFILMGINIMRRKYLI